VIINNCLYFSLFANTFKTVLENIKTKIISIIQRVGVSSGLSCKSEIILESHENAFSKSSKPHIIPSKYLLSLNNTKFFSQIFFVRISGKTHSTQYQVAIFHDLSSIAIRTTNQLSLSFFQTQISCQISVDTDDMSSPSVVGIITNNISAVYLSLISWIFDSMFCFSVSFKTHTLSTIYEFIFHKDDISKDLAWKKQEKSTKKNSIFIIIFFILHIIFKYFFSQIEIILKFLAILTYKILLVL